MATKDMEGKRCAAVDLLYPVSVSLLQNPTPKNAKALIGALGQVDPGIIQDLQSYVLYPLETGLKNKNLSEASILSLCQALMVVLKKSRVRSLKTFFELHVRLLGLFDLVQSIPADGGDRRGSEEGHVTKIKSIMSLLEAADEDVLSELYCFQYLPMVAQSVTHLLNIIKTEQSRELKVLAMECILSYMQSGSESGENYAVQLGDFFSHCFPGIFSCMFSVATSSVSTQGQAILVKSLEVCSRLVTLTLSDRLLALSQDKLRKNSFATEPTSNLPQALRDVYCERSEAWVSRAVTNASPMLRSLCNLASHSHWRVRLAVVEFAEKILASCRSSLSCCVPCFLESLVGLIHDAYDSVARKAVAALQAFKSSQADTQGERTLLHILEDNLYDLATVLPRQMKFYDEDKKPHLIKLLLGYISLLGPGISGFVSSAPHIKRVCLVLVQILEMDATNVKILEDRGSQLYSEPEVFTESNSPKIWRPRKYFRHFREEVIFSELMNVCRQLGKFGNIYILVDHMLELYQESDQYKLAAVLVINEMVTGAALAESDAVCPHARDPQLLKDVIKLLLEEYLSPDNLRLVDFSKEQNPSSLVPPNSHATSCTSLGVSRPSESQLWKNSSLANKNRAVLLSCLFMEGVGKFATALGRDFQVHLINGLYPLVENLGHENVHISSTSYSALLEVAAACGYRSLDQLIQENVDYLVRSVSKRLRHFDQHLRSPQTICVMLRYCSQDLLYLIDHSVTEMLETLDENYIEHLVLFMPVLLELVKAIGRWFPPQKKTKTEEPTRLKTSDKIDVDQLLAEINEYAKNKEIAEGDFTDESVCDNDGEATGRGQERTLEDIEGDMRRLMAGQDDQRDGQEEEAELMKEEEDEERKRDPPKHVVIVKEVFKRIKNLMSYHEPRLRVLALDVVSCGCQDLLDYERELLPQIHQLWRGLACLFHHQEKFVVIKAMQTLLVLTNLSGDFLRSRVMKEVVPDIVQYMEKQGKISCESRSAYIHSTHYKLQLCVLSSLGPLATNFALDGNDLDTFVNICLPYLCDLQPLPLQNATVESFSTFIDLDPDALWYKLCQVYCPVLLTPPGPEFIQINFPYGPTKENRYSTRIKEIFNKHFS